MLVFHEDCATVDIDDADGVSSASRHMAGGLCWVLRIRLEHDLPDLSLDVCGVVIL